jgi:hypothetical protein
LKNALEISRWAEPDHEVIEYLATLAPVYPALAVDCLSIMVEGDKEGWGIRYWSTHARTILAIALSHTNIDIKQSAEALIHQLGARGYFEFRDLIQVRN